MNKLIYLSIATCLIITGCASTSEPVVYDSSHSRAYNIAQAGGLYDVKDKKVPRADYESLSFISDSAENTLLFTSSAGLGMNLSEDFGVGLLKAALGLLCETASWLGCLNLRQNRQRRLRSSYSIW